MKSSEPCVAVPAASLPPGFARPERRGPPPSFRFGERRARVVEPETRVPAGLAVAGLVLVWLLTLPLAAAAFCVASLWAAVRRIFTPAGDALLKQRLRRIARRV